MTQGSLEAIQFGGMEMCVQLEQFSPEVMSEISQNEAMALIRSPRGEIKGGREEDYEAERKQREGRNKLERVMSQKPGKKCCKNTVPDTTPDVIHSFRMSTEMILLDLTMRTSFGYLIKGVFMEQPEKFGLWIVWKHRSSRKARVQVESLDQGGGFVLLCFNVEKF